MPRPEFVHLHLHTEFSFLDGISPIGELFDWVKEIEQPGVAITDHGECSGHIQADKFGYDRGIKPIFGMEGYFADSRHDKKGKKRSEHDHITLLSLNNRGLENLWTLSTLAWTEGTWYGDPRMDWELLEKYNEGLIVTSGCLSGVVTKYIREDHDLSNPDKGIERISRMLDIFGDRFYVELHTFDDDIQKEVNTRLVEIASEFGLPTIAVSDSHYLRPEDWQKHELVTAVSIGKDLHDESRYQYGEAQLDVKPVEDVVSRLSYLPEEIVKESVENTVEIYKQVDVSLPYDRATPVFFDNAKTDSMKVIDQAQEGLERKIFPTVQKKSKRKEYVQRLEFELKVITQKDLAGYFLMMADIVKWAKDQGIATGPSRGSGGGSLLAYVLDITEVDPVATGLLFERFLNPGRDALPDIDIDFEEEGRDRVIEYLREKYGEYAVATIGTINRWKPKQMMRDLARGLKIPINESNKMSEVIENIWNFDVGVDVTWKEVAERPENQEALAYWRNKYPYLFELMNDLFLNCRHTGAHAGGVVVNKESLLGKIPMRYRNNDMRTQFEMDEVEALGYPKMDFLGLRNLSTLKRAWEIIHERNDVDLPFFYDWQYEWDKYYGDQDVIRGLWGGNNIGVFQLETSNLMGLIKDFKPNSLEEIAELISVFRPGITRTVDEDTGENMLSLYLKRRHGLLPPKKYHPIADKILEETYSHFVYQEQVMQIFGELADYTETERDDIRKIIGKKKTYEFPKHREALRQRAWEYHQVPYETSDKIFDDLEKTGEYCLSGDTEVHIAHGNNYKIRIDELYRKVYPNKLEHQPVGFEGPCVNCGYKLAEYRPKYYTKGLCNSCYVWRQKFFDPNRGSYTYTVHSDDRIRPCKILDVLYQGKNDVYWIRLANGRSIKSTLDHKHLTLDGLQETQALNVGDKLITIGEYEHTQYDYKLSQSEPKRQGAVQGAFGESNYAYRDGNFVKLMEWTQNALDHCEFCGHDGSESRLERAHLDGDRTNNEHSNLAMLCVSCHKKHDYHNNNRTRKGEKGYPSNASEIISIEYVGEEDTYDLVVDDPHIFIANGIATSNSFNKAHAMGYAIIAFWGAYLKHYWPTEYLTALFQTDSAKTEVYTREAHRLGIEVLPPDINESDMGFTLTKDGRIRYGLKRIKYVANGAKLLTELRPFDDVFDFAERVPKSKFKKTAVESLVRVGALDSIVSEVDQYSQDWSFKKIALHQYWSMRNELSNNKEWRDIDEECEECRSRHTNFDHYVNELKLDDLVYNEQEFLGTVVSFDPLEEYMPIISKEMRYPGEDFMIPGETARLGGLIESRRDLKTKRGRNPGAPMCQFWLQLPLYVGSDEEDTEPSIQIVAFPDVFGRYQDDIEKGTPVLCDVEKLENGGVRLVRLFNLLYLE